MEIKLKKREIAFNPKDHLKRNLECAKKEVLKIHFYVKGICRAIKEIEDRINDS